MSFSNPTITTPAQKFFRWKSAIKTIVWYDRDSEEELPVSLPFRFIVLDELTTIKGYSDKYQSGIWSNEVRNIKSETLNVKVKSMTIVSGTYDNIKDNVKAQGGKFAASVYVAYQQAKGENGEWVLGNINFSGASLGEWFDFRKKHDLQVQGAVLTGSKEDKKGATTFYVPTFDTWSFEPHDIETGIELDKQLQKYLDTYFNRSEQADLVNEEAQLVEDIVIEDIEDDKPIDLSEIPF